MIEASAHRNDLASRLAPGARLGIARPRAWHAMDIIVLAACRASCGPCCPAPPLASGRRCCGRTRATYRVAVPAAAVPGRPWPPCPPPARPCPSWRRSTPPWVVVSPLRWPPPWARRVPSGQRAPWPPLHGPWRPRRRRQPSRMRQRPAPPPSRASHRRRAARPPRPCGTCCSQTTSPRCTRPSSRGRLPHSRSAHRRRARL
mmetsp:Transcript_33258/g.87017  ORF Transcript_33258/g.87017 Transcript_33258/m.87017 type:complete len:202 (-) Transcript_33258:38-643(-)